jgi:hypothetical protein
MGCSMATGMNLISFLGARLLTSKLYLPTPLNSQHHFFTPDCFEAPGVFLTCSERSLGNGDIYRLICTALYNPMEDEVSMV